VTNPTLVWFRRDLRVTDNPALHWALNRGDHVIALYIHNPQDEAPWSPGGASRWWLHQSLKQLGQELARQGIKLHLFAAPAIQVLTHVIQSSGAGTLAWNESYDSHFVQRDLRVKEIISDQITIKTFTDGVLFRPGTLLNKQDKPYRVFTPFWKTLRQKLEWGELPTHNPPLPQPQQIVDAVFQLETTLDELQLLDQHPWHDKLNRYWQPGEQHAQQRLQAFIRDNLQHYATARDIPGQDGTSMLSAHLHFGEISPLQVYRTIEPILHEKHSADQQTSLERFMTELAWREFAKHIIWHYPATAIQSMQPHYEKLWGKPHNPKLYSAWIAGRTGIPLVDAGMRQLWEMGWMHNRVRMIVGSFLTKNLGIHWKYGAAWFWDTLVDADLANNSLGWQWVAGCGVDAAPYYRIFNPQSQAQRYDAGHEYIKRWLPDVNNNNYPTPIINLTQSREQALQRYKTLVE